jgi:type II secretory pathway component GspD/PulD (secretin)
MMIIQKRLALCVMLCTALAANGQSLKSMDFRNQSIIDILMVLAGEAGVSILPDETVTGSASFYFSDATFDEVLNLFLSGNRLYQQREGNIIRVSRIGASQNPATGLVSMKAEDVSIENLIKALARTINTSIVYETLPAIAISVDMEDLEIAAALEILTRRLEGFTVEQNDSYYYIHRVPPPRMSADGSGEPRILRTGERYSISLEHIRFQELLEELFKTAEKEFSILTKTDSVLDGLYFADKDFDTLLRLILEQGSADYTVQDGIYYITELQRRDVLKKFRDTRILPLRNIAVQDFPSLLPPELAAGNLIKIDRGSNALILNGTHEELTPIVEFAVLLDSEADGRLFRRFELKFLNVQDLLTVLPPQLVPLSPVAIPHANAFMASGSAENLAALETYLAAIDRREEGYPIRLKFIKLEDLLKNLPPSVTKDDLSDSGYPNLVFFNGPAEKRELFLRELELIDRPRPQIRYELLVIEYLKNDEIRLNRSFNVNRSDAVPGMSFLGNISNIFNLNFDVVTQFGYQFAASLSAQLGENTAQVYADTTLNGLSGQEIKFRNTDTYRYQEFEVDADTGNVSRTGVTREISSGLIVSLNGWVSGDDMITMTVNATVSKQNNNPAANSTAIPSTSERIVTTQIRTPSGRPIVLSGLMKNDSNRNRKKFPILGDIPVLNLFFSDRVDTTEQTEIVIYIVPYLNRDEEEEANLPLRLERYYHSFVEGIIR